MCVSKVGLYTQRLVLRPNFPLAITSSSIPADKQPLLMLLWRYYPLMKKTNPQSVWSLPPETLALQPAHVDIWRVSLKLPVKVRDRLEAILSEDEKERAARFHFAADRERFIAAHGCLRDVLSRYLSRAPDQFHFSTNAHGKPALNGHNVEFNLSHSGDFALIAIAQECRVGVDVERIRSGISSHVIAQQYFSTSEFEELQSLPLEQRETAFFTCWTRKEAYIKAQGQGLSLPLKSFDVSLLPNAPAILRATRPNSDEAARWMLLALDVDPCYQAAVAAEGKGLQIRLWDWTL
jgi:4'-phosphopantetheinyl transferase